LSATLQAYSEVEPGSLTDRTWHFYTMGFYAQDSWRIKPRLTLNIGLRYEPTSTITDSHGLQSGLVNILTDTMMTIGPPMRIRRSRT